MLSLVGGLDFFHSGSGSQEKKVKAANPLKSWAQNLHSVTSAVLCWSTESKARQNKGKGEIDPTCPGKEYQRISGHVQFITKMCWKGEVG